MSIYYKIIFCCLLIFSCFILMCCDDSKTEPLPETPPAISVCGQNPQKTGIYLQYLSDSLFVSDLYGIDTVWNENNIDTAMLGYYEITYYALSLSGMESSAQRDVWVVVKPESMTGIWNVNSRQLPDLASVSYIDSLKVESSNLIINNFNNIEGAKITLSLVGDLQDSVYIFEQYVLDSLYGIFGNGTIDKNAMTMTLLYQIIEKEDTTSYNAVYSRDSVKLF